MPSGMLRIKDGPPIYGMNTIDDPKSLKTGECLNLENLFPGNPPLVRNGCLGTRFLYLDSSSYLKTPIKIFGFTEDAIKYAVMWIYNDNEDKTYLVLLNVTGLDLPITLGYISGDDIRSFGMLDLNSWMYLFTQPAMTSWNGASTATGNKVIESASIVRDMSISVAAEINEITQTVDAGPFSQNEFYQYAFQYVRRNDSAAFEAGATPSGMILPRGITGQPKRIDTFLPGICVGIEDISNRKTVEILVDSTYNTIDINIAGDHATAISQGATHLRVSRTRTQTSLVLAEGATKFFLMDLPLLGSGTTSFDDETSDASLSGELNQLLTGYSAAPEGSFVKYHKGRLFIMSKYGKVYYSEVPGGDGAYSSDLAETYPEAWSSLFKPLEYFLDCDSSDGTLSTGIDVLEDDIFFFKENKVFVLYGGNPNNTNVTLVNGVIGCQYPNTLILCEIKNAVKMLFFMSNKGPARVDIGGRLSLFSEFKIKKLWPQFDGSSLFEQYSYGAFNESTFRDIWDNTTAFFYNNTVWVVYETIIGEREFFGFYIDPISDYAGAMQLTLAISIFGGKSAVDKISNKAYLFGRDSGKLFILDFLQKNSYEDIDSEGIIFEGEPVVYDEETFIFEEITTIE